MAKVPEEVAYSIRQVTSPVEIKGDTYVNVPPPSEEVFHYILYVDDEAVGRLVVLKKFQNWWNDYAFVREDMRGKGLYPLLLKEVFALSAQFTDFTWSEAINTTPEDHYRRENDYGVVRNIMSVKIGTVPVKLSRWSEYRKVKNITSSLGINTVSKNDLRGLKK